MKNFLGKGFAFPLRVDGRGMVEYSVGERSIAEAIRLVLGTAVGERIMRPDFGCAIHELVFHPVNANTCSMVSLYVQQALIKWEPRIEGINVNSYPDPSNENTILIVIDYRVRSTNNLHNMVYPFFLRREQDLMIPTPNLDDRKFDDIVEEAIRLIPQYCPEWTNFNKADPGITLLELFAWMTEMVIYRLNRVPENNYLAFLNMMGIRLRPPQPSRTIVQFDISEKTDMVTIGAGTRVATKPEGDTPALVFETERDLVGISNKLLRCMSQHERTFNDNTLYIDGGVGAFEVFGGARSIERYLYLGDDRFSAFNEDSILIMRFEAQATGDRQFHELLEWEYWDGSRWREMTRPSMDLERNTAAYTGPPAYEKTTVNEVETFWIRGRLFEVPHNDEETILDTISARIEVLGEGITPEHAITNAEADIFSNLDLDKNFAPFGKEPAIDSTFYIGSDEVFSQPNTIIKIESTLSDQAVADVARPSHDLVLRWEYNTGKRWKVLAKVKFSDESVETDFDFVDGTKCFTQSGAIGFNRPEDMGSADVNGTEATWVRCRIEAGNFGVPGTYALEDDTWVWKDENPLRPPHLKEMRLKFQEQPHTLKTVFVYNDFVFTDCSKLAAQEYKPFQVFQPVSEESPTFYLGWENPFPNDTSSIYFNIIEQEGIGGRAALGRSFEERSDDYIEQRVVWEYWGGKSWLPLAPRDSTENFTQSGFIEFVGPNDFRKSRRFGESLYWLRARLEMGGYDEPPRCNRIMINAVHAQNVTTYGDTVLGSSQGTPNQAFHFPRGPVLDGEVVLVRERDMPPPDELEELRERWGTQDVVREDPDYGGFWVRWEATDSFYDKNPRSRNYIKDITSGQLQFGDGVRGMIPPKGEKNVRAALYQVGGGSHGNVPANSIVDLQRPLAFVTAVANAYPAMGGCDMETVEEAKLRAPHMLKARDRAVTVDDFEWLAREASNSVARVKCLPSTAREGEVTVIVVPRASSGDALTEKPVPTVELLKKVRGYLSKRRLVSTVVNVVRPSYAEASLRIEIVCAQSGASDKIKKNIEREVRRFLHPLRGWRSEKGWPFGRSLLKVDLYQVVESVDGVDLVDKIRIYDEGRGGFEVEQLRVHDDQLIHLVDVTVVEKAHDRIV